MSKQKIVLLGVPAALVGILGIWQLTFGATDDSVPESVQPSPAEARHGADEPIARVAARRLSPPPETPREEFREPALSARDQKVQAQLQTFMKRTASISAESVARERQRVEEGLKNALAREVEVPRTRLEADEHGERWERMEYSNGITRYFPAPEEEKKP